MTLQNRQASTAVPSASPTPKGSNTSKKGSSITAGEVAGIGIGTAVVGALIAAILVWFCMRRLKRSDGGSRRRHSRRESDAEKTIGVRNQVTLEENLLDRADDSQIRKLMQDLNELIDQHCQNHYHLHSFEPTQGILERHLVECGYGTSPSVQDMVSLLLSPRTRFTAIRQIIATVILDHISWKTNSKVSLLPPQIAAFCEAIQPVESQPGSQEVFDKAFTKWRHLTAFLLEPVRSNREAPKANERELQEAIGRNVALINGVLEPFIKASPESQRYQKDNLSAIIFEGAQLGLLLFSQPAVWVFGWDAPVPGERGERVKSGTRVVATERRAQGNGVEKAFVVFPSLGEKIDRHGTRRIRNVVDVVVVDVLVSLTFDH